MLSLSLCSSLFGLVDDGGEQVHFRVARDLEFVRTLDEDCSPGIVVSFHPAELPMRRDVVAGSEPARRLLASDPDLEVLPDRAQPGLDLLVPLSRGEVPPQLQVGRRWGARGTWPPKIYFGKVSNSDVIEIMKSSGILCV